ncbi:MAG: hypothetical protein ACJAT4_001987 [Granulosicoccus sp.]|jgi:hypothetical protein
MLKSTLSNLLVIKWIYINFIPHYYFIQIFKGRNSLAKIKLESVIFFHKKRLINEGAVIEFNRIWKVGISFLRNDLFLFLKKGVRDEVSHCALGQESDFFSII